jgi:hypothetical protein
MKQAELPVACKRIYDMDRVKVNTNTSPLTHWTGAWIALGKIIKGQAHRQIHRFQWPRGSMERKCAGDCREPAKKESERWLSVALT